MLSSEGVAVIFLRRMSERFRNGHGHRCSRLRYDFLADERIILQGNVNFIVRPRLHLNFAVERERCRCRRDDAPRGYTNT